MRAALSILFILFSLCGQAQPWPLYPGAGVSTGISIVNRTSKSYNGNPGSTPTVTDAMSTVNATTIVVIVASFGGSTPNAPAALTDNAGNTWGNAIGNVLIRNEQSGTSARISAWKIDLPNTSASHTFSAGYTLNGFSMVTVYALKGTKTSGGGSLDQQSGSNNAAATSSTPGSITPSVNNSMIFTASMFFAGQSPISIGSGIVNDYIYSFVGGNQLGCAFGYLLQGTAAAINPTFSWGNGNQANATLIFNILPQ